MIASLPMYDRPETAAANDRFWQGIRAVLGHGPASLARGTDPWAHWRSPDLLLSQTCGYPYRACLHGRVQLVATPDHGIAGCPPGHYCSVLVCRRDDPRGLQDFAEARFAYNEPLSQSGWAAPQTYAHARGVLLGQPVRCGSHRGSARAVAAGQADLAALDVLSWQMMCAHDDFAARLREVARTPPTPALPYITGPEGDAAALRAALRQAIAGLGAADRATLGLAGLVQVPADAYLELPNPPAPAADPG
ncbi:MAG: PhnD/SsuA/transferrin family substrate-binding protein [Roseovarius sp.]|nr:PhnD/SsuA/transferrin family substrate-binding protein [Roseovarius sp.]